MSACTILAWTRCATGGALATVLVGLAVAAQAAWPEKPLRLVVPYPTGGAADLMGRSLASKLSERLGQPVILDNRAGAGGSIGAEAVMQATPDGYTLFYATMGTHAINVSLYPKLRYDPLRDFTPISLTHVTPRVLVVHPSLPARSVAELIVLARSRPGELSFGSAGNGSSSHLSGELFAAMTGIKLLHVPYKGSGPASTDLLGGRLSMSFDSIAVYADHIKAGKVRALGVTSAEPSAALPGVPAIARGDPGLRGYEVANWLGLVAPAATPRSVVNTIHAAVVASAADTAVRTQLLALGIEPLSSTPEAFAALMREEIDKWARIVRASGARVD